MSTIQGTGVREYIEGTAFDDVLAGGDGGDTLSGGDGADYLTGHSAADGDPATGLIVAQRVASGLSNPLFGVSPPGQPDRLFVLEQHTGRIQVLELGSNTVRATPFLDLPDNELSHGSEQGALGLAFHPQYAANGRFFVDVTNAAGNTEIWEYRRATADQADPGSRKLLLSIEQPFANHNGGWLGFGPDGLLYIGSGDGGSVDDPRNNAQNRDSLLGKILRIDVDADAFPSDSLRNYAIPPTNPFAASAGADEVWAYGLRNPWRLSFDSATGDLYIADVGQGAREEIDYLPAGTGAGANFGWREREGFAGPAVAGALDPVLDYTHGSGPFQGRSATGGYVYHGPGGAQGLYVFADYVSGNLWTARVTGGAAQDFVRRNDQLLTDAGRVDQIASFAVDGSGRLYAIGLDGEIHRLTPGVTAGDAGDLLAGGAGDDTLDGGVGGDSLWGDSGGDVIRGLADNDFIDGGAQADTINGNTGADTVNGGDGADSVLGGQDGDLVSGGAGDDVHVNGNIGNDTVDGGPGADTVHGGQNDDILFGDEGDDRLSGDRGSDLLFGGPGADRFVLIRGGGADTVGDFRPQEGDRVLLPVGAAYTVRAGDNQALIDIGGGDVIGLAGVQASSFSAGWLMFG